MHIFKLIIEYEGTCYAGWQVQENALTIQKKLETALRKLYGVKVNCTASGRTDAGVHALGQTAHFKVKSSKISSAQLPKAINAHLPCDIRVQSAENVLDSFHAQFDARSKLYRYTIFNNNIESVFGRNFHWFIPYSLNMLIMERESKILLGRHDFKAFQAKDKKERSSIRNIIKLELKKKKEYIIIDIEANGFLYNMVRNIVGTLVEIGRGKFPEGSMEKILQSKNRRNSGPTAPAKGLCLIRVNY